MACAHPCDRVAGRARRERHGVARAAAILSILLTAALVAPAQADPGGGQSLEGLTRAVGSLAAEHDRSDPGVAREVLADLLAVVEERRALLAGLAETDPAAVLEAALPSSERRRLPPAVQAKLEREVELEGEVAALYEDYEDHAVLRHFLKANGKRHSLHFAGELPELLTGDRVRVRGVEVPLESGSEEAGAVVAYCCNGDGTEVTQAAAVPNTFGEQRTLVLLVNFTDRQTEPWSVDEARQLVFGDASDFMFENSYGQTWLAGDVYGWFTIGAATCRSTDISSRARQAAEAAGIDVSTYSRRVYAFPDIGCPGAGLASIGGNPSSAWIEGTLHLPEITNHELGHNLGLYHSHGLDCIDRVLAPQEECNYIEYGDVLDVMGGWSMHFNAFQKERLGWLGNGSSPAITTVDAEGTYEIEPYAAQGAGPKALKLLRSVDPLTGQRTFYYLEYRQAVGFDSLLADERFVNNENGVVVRLGTEGDPGSSFLLDMTPDSQLFDWRDPALHVGVSYSDAETGIALSTLSTDGGGATVSVNLSGSPCMTGAPALSLAPSQGPLVEPGTPVDYTVTVTNQDGAGCAGSRFDLVASVPTGWAASPADASLWIDPGTSGTTTLQVVSPSSAAEGSYGFSVAASDAQLPGHEATASGSYAVGSGADNAPPVAEDDAATTFSGASVVVDVLANDSDPDGDPLSVADVSQPEQGSAVINPDSTVTYVPRKGARRSDLFTYDVTDGKTRSSASVAIKLARGKGRKK